MLVYVAYHLKQEEFDKFESQKIDYNFMIRNSIHPKGYCSSISKVIHKLILLGFHKETHLQTHFGMYNFSLYSYCNEKDDCVFLYPLETDDNLPFIEID